jgi:hypothetical protein
MRASASEWLRFPNKPGRLRILVSNRTMKWRSSGTKLSRNVIALAAALVVNVLLVILLSPLGAPAVVACNVSQRSPDLQNQPLWGSRSVTILAAAVLNRCW